MRTDVSPPQEDTPQDAPQIPINTTSAKKTWYKKKSVIVGGVLGLIVIGAAAGNSDKTAAPSSKASGQQAPTAEDPPFQEAVVPPAPPEPPAYIPKAADFKLTTKTLEKKCFGSAGCNVTYRINVAYTGSPLDPDQEYELTYEVRGGEDGPQVNTLTLQGTSVSVDDRETISTSSSKAKLTVVVLEVAPK